MNPLFTSIGEILVDFTPIVEDGRTNGFRLHPGGAPFNVAVGLARLGQRVEFAGKASTDFFGRVLVEHLEREGIGTRFLSRSPAPSTLAFVALEGGEPTYSFYGEGAADRILQSPDVPAEIEESDVLHFGSISLVHAPTSTTVAGLVERLRGRVLLSFDPNVRPGLITDGAAYRSLIERLFRAADIVRLSGKDLSWLRPGKPLEPGAWEIYELGPALVVVTQGLEGCLAVCSSGTITVPALQVPVVDTVGAGDAFTAGLLSGLAERGVVSRGNLVATDRDRLSEALQFAAVAAALTCARAGADPPRAGEVEAALARGIPERR